MVRIAASRSSAVVAMTLTLAAVYAPVAFALIFFRLVQGLGSGAMMVALYVVVARVYPEELHCLPYCTA